MRRQLSMDFFGVAREARFVTYGSLAAGCLLFLVIVVAAFLIPSRSLFSTSPPPPAPLVQSDGALRTGTIQLAPTRGNLCPQLELDNKSGGLREKGLKPCDPPAVPVERNVGPQHRYNSLNQVRDSFNKR
jgi:hypothetical protein